MRLESVPYSKVEHAKSAPARADQILKPLGPYSLSNLLPIFGKETCKSDQYDFIVKLDVTSSTYYND